MKKLIALMALVSASTLGLQAPAHAAGSAEQIALCAEALRTGGLAPEDAFKTEFKGIKGASLRTVTMKLFLSPAARNSLRNARSSAARSSPPRSRPDNG